MITRCNSPEDENLYCNRRENFKSYIKGDIFARTFIGLFRVCTIQVHFSWRNFTLVFSLFTPDPRNFKRTACFRLITFPFRIDFSQRTSPQNKTLTTLLSVPWNYVMRRFRKGRKRWKLPFPNAGAADPRKP